MWEELLRSPGFAERSRPDLVLRLGAAPTSKPLTALLGPEVPQLLVDPDGAWLDPGRGVAERLAVDPEPLLTALADALAPAAERHPAWLRSWRDAERGADATFVVLDNDGGGIFSFLPQAEQPEHFELLFGTPHGVDLAALPSMHGLPADRVEKAGEVVPAVEAAIAAGGVRFVIVPTERADNVRRHREAWKGVASALSD